MRREMVSLEELRAKLREHGVEHLQEVRLATMESDGTITVLQAQAQQQPQNRSRGSRPPG